ncbi:MAG TPA: ATP-binding cassette domain-containing protein [Actinospica sp.]|jgi:ABC-type glutathione transport system ATPase component|nr:ATP-binding cassette domain-containing protein [Actinospica sp.]
MSGAATDLLEIDGLVAGYGARHTPPVLDGVSLAVRPGEIVGLIGETGSGKTTLARAAVGLVPARAGRIVFAGTELTGLGGRALRGFRRRGEVQYVFQDPLRALDPDLTAAASVAEPLAAAGIGDRDERAERAALALRAVGLDAAHGTRLPGRLSGGQRQRVLLARALITEPRLLICDEPVSALDAANRNHVLRLLLNLRDESGIAALVITHDLHSLSGVADRVAVLHQGGLVEQGPVREVLDAPQHSYTRRLLAAAPRLRTLHAPPVPSPSAAEPSSPAAVPFLTATAQGA